MEKIKEIEKLEKEAKEIYNQLQTTADPHDIAMLDNAYYKIQEKLFNIKYN